ncbi:hypothetical protein [Chryseosolibacter indicus]|uniref:YD repeat-containing protein n=1 Tax=Chryseosolibacter indicus TaxID=2782351 RepID=A0ABS5VY32_9BACT|nr:hypothetical protein [Chryseosolibacter indicus]MBT1704911.1 hypothetical protein [Chryseosolibacter indicus]
MKAFHVLLFLLFVHFSLYSQPTPTSEVNIMSPKAASILRYGEYPVSLHTGLIDITVPVYKIEGNGITVPIEFKYHASGIKFDDTSNEVGLGWSLIAGGVISRSVIGARDGETSGTYSRNVSLLGNCESGPDISSDYDLLREVENGSRGSLYYDNSLGRLDGEMDQYSFSFLNHSGSFCFPFSESEVVTGTRPSNGLFIPVNGMKVISHDNLMIELLDAEGVYYKFQVKDVDQNERFKEYYLTQIISADKADTVTFTYEIVPALSEIYVRRPFINYSATISTRAAVPIQNLHGQLAFPTIEVTEDGGVFYQSLRPPRLTRIDFRGGYVSFEYAVVNNLTTYNLQRINIYNSAESIPLQTVVLTKGTFTNGEQRLNKVTFSNSAGENYDYQFGYNGQPGNIYTNGGFYKGIDYWGYFNGSSVPNGRRYLPAFDNMPTQLQAYTANRDANESAMQGGILNKIIYPTKGYSEFTYQAHKAQYSFGTALVTGGGLRIYEIKNYLEDGTLAEKKWYKYGEGESGIGIANTYPDKMDFLTQSRTLITHNDGYINIPHLCEIIYTDRYSTFPKLSYFLSGSSAVYPQVTEYIGNDSEALGKTVYRYEVFPDEKLNPYGATYRQYSPDTYLRTNQWKTGNLLSKKVYKKEGAIYQEIQSIVNTYKDINTSEFRNVHVLPYVEFGYNYPGQNLPDIKKNYCSPLWAEHREHFGGVSAYGSSLSPYDYYNYFTSTGQRVLSATDETIDGVTTHTSYATYNEIGRLTNFTRITSAGDNVTTNFKYPADFTYSPYINMKAANILTPVIEKTIYNNGNLLKREVSRYGFWHSRFFALSSYEEGYGNESPVSRLTYSYDLKGNIQELFKDDGTKSVYLWGYRGRYPIAQILNTTYNEVKNVLGQALIDRVTDANTPSDADLLAINNLRNSVSLSRAKLRTYMYRPLIGMASQTDFNGRTTYYRYDSFGRLKYMEDNDGNLVQKYNYHYKQ